MTTSEALSAAAVTALDGLRLANALRAGIYRLFEQTDHINKINVFPVPDGDTGTNLSMTLSAVLAALDREPQPHAGALLVRIADAALDGARGNSGAILAQFLLGLADKAGPQPALSATDFANAAATGAAYARDALSQPREGTVLTVLRDFADELQVQIKADPTVAFKPVFAAALTRARRSLAATTDQLEELRSAHVVDAGAQGFVELLEGIQRYLDTGEIGTASAAPTHRADAETMAESAFVETRPQLREDQPRYCTECLIAATEGTPDLELRRLREGLSALGASLVVGGNKRKAKVHIHTDDPERVFEFAETFGTLTGQKADDMQRQQDAAHHAKGQRVAIVVDSAADIPEDLLESLGIHVVPVRIHFGNRSYLDKVTMTPTEFYQELRTNPEHPKTSQPPPGDFRRMYEFLASHYESVVSIALSSKVSGTCNAATTAASRVAPRKDGTRAVTVVDSLSISAGQALIAIAAAELAKSGASADEVIAAVREAIPRTRAFALLGSVDYAVKGGRVPKFARLVANLLRLSIILATQPDGRVTLGGALWGRHNLTERFARFVARRAPRLDIAAATGKTSRPPHVSILIGHGDARGAGQAVAQHLQAALPPGAVSTLRMTDMGTALGVHGGPGTLIVGLQLERLPTPPVT
jgi:hypothetical protein